MPRGTKGEKRRADVIGAAVMVGRIATGKDKAAQAMGRKGGAARAKAMTPDRRAEIAKAAVAERWRK